MTNYFNIAYYMEVLLRLWLGIKILQMYRSKPMDLRIPLRAILFYLLIKLGVSTFYFAVESTKKYKDSYKYEILHCLGLTIFIMPCILV